MTCGPWKPIYLELYNTRISDIAFSMKLSENLDTVEVSVFAEIEGSATAINFEIVLDGQKIAEGT